MDRWVVNPEWVAAVLEWIAGMLDVQAAAERTAIENELGRQA
ncbi:hypothetical protein [Burkholderia gladioli]|nr:hypothetical protein [Burkholderia gladioli]